MYLFFEGQISVLNFLLIAIGLVNISEDILSSVLILPYIREGENQLVVCVDNCTILKFHPFLLISLFFGGIYRDVSLISVSPIHISTTHYASSGVYVNTPEITEEKALVDICTMLSNTQAERSKIFCGT